MRTRLLTPHLAPVWCFLAAILCGALLLQLPASQVGPGASLSFVDALFTATSAVCVTGLAVQDTGTFFSPLGQTVLLALIQLGGLGIMTYTSLTLYLLGHKVSLSDRIAVGQSLLRDPGFNLGKFVAGVVLGTLTLELSGALLLWAMDPVGFSPWSALFHAVSAFCNAGFSLFSDSLTRYHAHWGVNLVIMALIILGGLGFAVLADLGGLARRLLRHGPLYVRTGPQLLPLHTRVVLTTSAFLVVAGTVLIFFAEWGGTGRGLPLSDRILSALFQSVSCRTAGFNTVDIGSMTNAGLTFMMLLMFIGGSPGSTAGGIKTTTARTLAAYVIAQFRGREQVRVGVVALSRATRQKAIALIAIALVTIVTATMLLEITEGGTLPHPATRGQFLETLFEVVSALGTVGLSMGKTTTLSPAGKCMVALIMFIGRIGPIWLLAALQDWQQQPRYRLPENDLPLG